MLKKTITYETFDGEEKTEDFFFHLSKADLVEMEMSSKGGLKAHLERIIKSQDGRAIMDEFKKLVLGSYGKKSDDGTKFTKTAELREEFLSSPAYDVLFMELVTDATKAAEFVNGIIPKGLAEQVAAMPQPARTLNEQVEAERIKEGVEPRLLTRTEATEMSHEELSSGIAEGRYRLS